MVKSRGVACCCVAALCVSFLVGSAGAATINVDQSTTHQTIDGFGAFASMPNLYRAAGQFWEPRPDAYELDRFIIDLGASAVRFELPPSIYPTEGEPYDWGGTVFGTGGMSNSFRLMREFIKEGTDRFIFSVWSPPCWMKESGECVGPYEASASAGHLHNWINPSSGNFQKLADFLADFCVTVEDSVGVKPYGISIQNEPYFHEPYNSCIYYEEALNTMVTLARASLDAAGMQSVRIYGAEHMFHNGTGYYGVMLDNPGLDVWAIHGYTNGVDPDYGTASEWATMYNTVSGKGKKLWMTETTGSGNLLGTARSLHAALMSGKVSLWTWWAYADNMGTYGQTDGVNTSFIPDGTYWGSRHYFRFIRPGATMIGCSSDQSSLWATAFKNPDNTYAVVLVNTATSATTATIAGSGMPANWQRYESSASRKCEHTGQVGASGISVPASGVVTLISGDPVPVLPADTTSNSVAAPTPSSTIGELNVKGDDAVDVYVNGNLVNLGDDLKGLVQLVEGENVVAFHLRNHAWGGGLVAAMLLPGEDTLRSGNTWKFTYEQPAASWVNHGFDDSGWRQTVDVGPVDIWPGFARWGLSAVNLYYWGARWLYCDTKMYFRKTINVSGTQQLRVFGNNFHYTVWVDGQQVGSGSQFDCSPDACIGDVNPVNITALSAGTHTIAWEIVEANVDGNGVLFKGWSQPSPSEYGDVVVDSSWLCWPDEVNGWNQPGFDDSQWFHPGNDRQSWMGRGPNNSRVPYCYPREFWYRTTFTSQQATGLRVQVHKSLTHLMPKVEYYNLKGQKTSGKTPRGIANSVLLRKVIAPDGSVHTRKMLKVK
ncbi:MAG: hypothetical protein GF331_23040 [Chitinivibrionales bacterium]|nr:hypothetical protein [Chitinivibrionales bacterium]